MTSGLSRSNPFIKVVRTLVFVIGLQTFFFQRMNPAGTIPQTLRKTAQPELLTQVDHIMLSDHQRILNADASLYLILSISFSPATSNCHKYMSMNSCGVLCMNLAIDFFVPWNFKICSILQNEF